MANEEQLTILSKGVEEWNQWHEYWAVEIDLSSANLSGADLSNADLSGADLSNANLSNANLIDANLSGANLGNANLIDANLGNANLRDAHLNGADLSNANLSNANLIDAHLNGADLCDASLSSAEIRGANLRGTDLREVYLRNANLRGANLRDANLSNANLRGANLRDANLSNANLSNANLSNANLSNANLSDANLSVMQALNTNFSQAEMTGACIHDWHINSATNFEAVVSDHIYRGIDDTQEIFADRLPVNLEQNFKDGEFEEWIRIQAEARKTIDLTFTDGIDWQAFFQSIQGVREQYPESAVGLQAIEKKGSAFVIRLETAPESDQGAIQSIQKELYETELQLREAQGELKTFYRMSTVLEKLADKPMTKNEIHIQNAGNVANEVHGSQKAIQHNYASERCQTPAESAKEIQDLLIQLQATNPTDIQSLVEETIKNDPTLRQRLKNALKEGGLESMKVIFPVAGIAIETVRGWVEAEGD